MTGENFGRGGKKAAVIRVQARRREKPRRRAKGLYPTLEEDERSELARAGARSRGGSRAKGNSRGGKKSICGQLSEKMFPHKGNLRKRGKSSAPGGRRNANRERLNEILTGGGSASKGPALYKKEQLRCEF